jgi:demethoxyubiquinone hydroxylase (CLK1/Coq7/Cat5 family)
MIWYTLAFCAGAAYGILRARAAEARARAAEAQTAANREAYRRGEQTLNSMLNSACDDIRHFRGEMEAAHRQLATMRRQHTEAP